MSEMHEQQPTNRRTMATFRFHLLVTSVFATGAFATVIAIAVFVPLAAQLDRVDLASEQIVGLADHFLFLHAALWPVVGLALLSCVASATVLYQRMRSPLVRFMRVFEGIEQNRPVDPIRIRKLDYLSEEERSLNRMIVAYERRRTSDRALVERLRWELDVLASHAAGDQVDIEGESRSMDRAMAIVKELESNHPTADDPAE